MTDYLKWIAENDIPLSPLFGGYESLGISFAEFRKRGMDINFEKLPTREKAIAQFSFAIPSEEVLTQLVDLQPLLEVGAGTGYWAYELRKRGADIIAVDPKPYSDNGVIPAKTWTEVLEMDAKTAIEKYKHRRTLFFCWPSYNLAWPTEALMQWTGKYVAFIGESSGGCTGDDKFHQVLETDFDQMNCIRLPQWSGIHDHLYVYERTFKVYEN